ncbi:MAG: tetratricopeptide repeat protein [Myxococcota bacterium]
MGALGLGSLGGGAPRGGATWSGLAACLLLASVGLSWTGRAAADSADRVQRAERRVGGAEAGIGSIEKSIKAYRRKSWSPQQRLADAVLLMGVKDYDRAADLLNQVVERHRDDPVAYADGLNLLGETYFLSGQYLSARRIYGRLVDDASGSRFPAYRERAAIRLVDIALRTRDLDGLDAVYARISRVPSPQGGVAYAKGKGLVAQERYGAAATELQKVGLDSPFRHQTKYLEGVAAMRQIPGRTPSDDEEGPSPSATKTRPADVAPAIAKFERVTQLPGDTAEHRHVIDLAWLAIGRLRYESQQWTGAVEAFNRVDRNSPELGTMLYELAWVYVQLGDVIRAQRALELLSVSAPDSDDVADAALLRGDLMLRSGQFDKSKKVYVSVRGTYEGMQSRVDRFMGASSDPGVYFDTLSRDQLELFEAGRALPPTVLRWARRGADGARAFAIIDDVALSRRLIRESNEMVERLNAVLASPNKIRALPGLKLGAEKSLGLVNSIALARVTIARGLDGSGGGALSGELSRVQAERKKLERRLLRVPVTPADFTRRDQEAQKQWNGASQALQRLELEVDQLQATVNGLERVIKDGPQAGVVRTPQQMQAYRDQLVEQRQVIAQYRREADKLRRSIEAGRVQVGFGDSRFVEDAEVRKRYRQLLEREVALSAQGRGGAERAAYARRVRPVLARADAAEDRIDAILADIDAQVRDKADELRSIVQRETANVVSYGLELQTLDQEARLVVGEVAMRNFTRVRDRLRDIVLRADVGITEQAWETREEQYTRVRRLKVEKARTLQRLNEELEEVLDDSVDPEKSP